MFVHEISLDVQIVRSHYCRIDWTSCSLVLVILRCVHVQDMQKIVNGRCCLCGFDLDLNQNNAMTTSGQIQPYQQACMHVQTETDRPTISFMQSAWNKKQNIHSTISESFPFPLTPGDSIVIFGRHHRICLKSEVLFKTSGA
jgi:hypothetical protein